MRKSRAGPVASCVIGRDAFHGMESSGRGDLRYQAAYDSSSTSVGG